MGTGYTRNDTANNIADGNVVNASDLDGEFDAIEAAFDESTGHTHDGTDHEGGPITLIGPAQEYLGDGTAFFPKTDDTYDLGKSSAEWKDLYIDGVAYLDSAEVGALTVSGTLDLTGVTVTGYPSITLGTEITASRDVTNADLTDRKLLEVNSASDIVITVPPSLTGTEPALFQKVGTGAVTFAAGSGVTIQSVDSSLTIAGQYSMVSLIPKGSDVYTLTGGLA